MSGSSPAFSASPLNGVLQPFDSDRDETKFVVTYNPKEYGKRDRARLVIQTEEAIWTYEVRGIARSSQDIYIDRYTQVIGEYPGFTPPVHIQSKMDTYMSPEILKHLGGSTRRSRNKKK